MRDPAFKAVDKLPDHTQIERRVLDRWSQERTAETLRDQNRGGPTYSFIDGPMTANNPMGVHHAWGRALKDIAQRYHAMQGYDSRYQNGFDCQGLWVEVEVERELELNSKRDIEEFGLDRFSRACRDRVARFAELQTNQSIRLGQWMDWDRSYFTMSDTNIDYIWAFLRVCNERGWLYKGHRPMPWCPRCGTSLSQHELIDSYAELDHPSVYVRFPLTNRSGEGLLVWTTTPWTLPANVAAAVHPDLDYARVEIDGQISYVGEPHLASLPFSGRVLEVVPGRELVGEPYENPFAALPAQSGVQHRVVAWEDVSADEGTAIVHIAPGCGVEDFELGQREELPVIIPVDDAGRFVDGYGDLTGITTDAAAPLIIEQLRSRGVLVHAGTITHRYPTCWRCATPLIFRVVDEWFISSDEIRQPMIDAARSITWQPAQYGKRMEDWLRNMGDWCISRRRYWGLPLPFYTCPDGHVTVIGSKDELKERATELPEEFPELHRPWIDEITIRCDQCGAEAVRGTEVGDCWLDAGIVPFASLGWNNPHEIPQGYADGSATGLSAADLPDHGHWERWFPADWICEMREQLRLWFYSMLFMSVTLIGEAPYRRVLTYEKVHDETGREMHKTWGNAIWFDDAVEAMGADVMRWSYAAQPPSRTLRFGYGPAAEVKRRLLTLWNSYAFFVLYANIADFKPSQRLLDDGPSGVGNDLDRWMIARTQELITAARQALDDYDTPRFVGVVEAFFDDLSNWYVRLSRQRFWKSPGQAEDFAAYETLWYALVQSIRVIAPVMPFIADEIWQNLVRGPLADAPPSVHLAAYPQTLPDLADDGLLETMSAARTVVDVARAARARAGIPVRQPLARMSVYVPSPQAAAAIERHRELIASELNIKEIACTVSTTAWEHREVVPNFRALGPKYGPDVRKIQQLLREGRYEPDGPVLRVGGWTLEEGEFEVRMRDVPGQTFAEEAGFAVVLDTTLTEELAREGRARNLIRQIQQLRKDADLDVTDHITIVYPADLEELFTEYGEQVRDETLAVSVRKGAELSVLRA